MEKPETKLASGYPAVDNSQPFNLGIRALLQCGSNECQAHYEVSRS